MLRLETGPRVARRVPDGFDTRPYERFSVAPLTPTIGAEVTGLDLREVDDDVFADLHRCLLEWKVLFFRDQHLDRASHAAFARRFGPLETHPFFKHVGATPDQPDDPEVVRFAKGAAAAGYENVWHTDVTWRDEPAWGAVLRAIEIPEVGGDTLWADMGAAYDGLPDAIRGRIDTLAAEHDWVSSFGRTMPDDLVERLRADFPPVRHPAVRTHPDTGRRTLFVNSIFTTRLFDADGVPLPADESDALLDLLCRRADLPEYQCRFRWTPGAVALWDNRATQHYASNDYFPQVRVMERVSIAGDRPF
jgi:taurine dioxygenase